MTKWLIIQHQYLTAVCGNRDYTIQLLQPCWESSLMHIQPAEDEIGLTGWITACRTSWAFVQLCRFRAVHRTQASHDIAYLFATGILQATWSTSRWWMASLPDMDTMQTVTCKSLLIHSFDFEWKLPEAWVKCTPCFVSVTRTEWPRGNADWEIFCFNYYHYYHHHYYH